MAVPPKVVSVRGAQPSQHVKGPACMMFAGSSAHTTHCETSGLENCSQAAQILMM